MELYDYLSSHSTRQSEALDWLVKQTHIRTNHARMLSGEVQGQLMKMIARMCGAHRVLELGTFTGYSAICLASGLPEDGHLDTLELNDELEELIEEGFCKAGLEDRISLHFGDCKETLVRFRQQILNSDGTVKEPELLYDLVYIDANKREYCEYYDLLFDLVRPGGYILADNVIWDGKVCQEPLPQDKQTLGIDRFNKMIAADPRVENVILPLRDGLNLIHRV